MFIWALTCVMSTTYPTWAISFIKAKPVSIYFSDMSPTQSMLPDIGSFLYIPSDVLGTKYIGIALKIFVIWKNDWLKMNNHLEIWAQAVC